MSNTEQQLKAFTNTRFLGMLDKQGQRRLLESAKALFFADGAVVVREGDPGDALYMILGGKATVTADNMGTPRVLAELSSGAFFGEIAVITNQPRSATVTARGQLSVVKIPKQVVLDVLNDYPKVKELVGKMGVLRTEDTLEKMMED